MKRHFPYTEKDEAMGSKKRSLQDAGHRKTRGTDFSKWTPEQIKDFLLKRGEDFDNSLDMGSLVSLAEECEYNTGPAKLPPAASIEAPDEVDTLDAFMAEIDQQVQANAPNATRAADGIECDEEADPVADYMEARRTGVVSTVAVAAAAVGSGYNSDDEVYATAKAVDGGVDVEYDSDDNPILKAKSVIEPLPALDHTKISYDDFDKDFYNVHKDIAAMSDGEVLSFRAAQQLKVSGFDPPRPVKRFDQCGFGPRLLSVIKKQGYESPTAIQTQGLPVALSGRDVLGIAKTGSGKTAAFILPMIVHIMAQPQLNEGDGPIGVIIAPTRELSEQTHKQARIFGKAYGLKMAACFGGLSKYEQLKELRAGSEAIIGTPGRIIDLIKMKACNMKRATFLVLDEADRVFDMGFEPQVRSIMGQIRPDRQSLLFSATMPPRVERLARDALSSPIRITVGSVGAANEDIRQSVELVANDHIKYHWLLQRLHRFVDEGDVLVFANKKARVDEIVVRLKEKGYRAEGMHGDMDQFMRMDILKKYREGGIHVLVATDVASRGLDIRSIKTVINFDSAKDIDGHIHRIGRTGRAGDKDGTAYTLITPQEAKFAGSLVQSLTAAGQVITDELHDLAMKDVWFKKKNQRGKGVNSEKRRPQVGGAGLGFSQNNPGTTSNPFGQSFTVGETSQTILQASKPPAAAAAPHPTIPAAFPNQDDALRSYHAGMFRTQFVRSGTAGGDLDSTPTVVAPKVASSRPVPPPPTPVTEKPIVTTPQPPLPIRRSGLEPTVTKTPEFNAAFAAAQAIAARLAGTKPPDHGMGTKGAHHHDDGRHGG